MVYSAQETFYTGGEDYPSTSYVGDIIFKLFLRSKDDVKIISSYRGYSNLQISPLDYFDESNKEKTRYDAVS